MKFMLLPILIISILYLSIPAYPSWTEYKDVRYIDLDGDLADEIIIESGHGAGSGHYVELVRIFKEDEESSGLKLIFMVTTLNSTFGYGSGSDDISTVEFTEQTPENNGIRDIIVKSKKIYYKDDDNKIIDREENLGIKVYKWNGDKFIKSEKDIVKPRVYVEDGNIYFSVNGQDKIQLTYDGKNRTPVLSPNNKQVVFVKQVKDLKDNPYGISDMDAQLMYCEWSPYEIWTVDVDGRKPRPLRRGSYKSQDPKEKTGWFWDLNFSPDGKKIYYACQPAIPTTNAIHSIDANGKDDKWICWGQSVNIVGGNSEDEHFGHLVVSRRADDGAYDVYVVMAPEGKEVEFIGISDQDFWKKHKKVE